MTASAKKLKFDMFEDMLLRPERPWSPLIKPDQLFRLKQVRPAQAIVLVEPPSMAEAIGWPSKGAAWPTASIQHHLQPAEGPW